MRNNAVFAFALALSSCVSARYSTTPSSRITNDCGEFVAESDTAYQRKPRKPCQVRFSPPPFPRSMTLPIENWYIRNPDLTRFPRPTVREVAARLRVCRATVYKLIDTGKLPARRVAGAWWRVRVGDVKAILLSDDEGAQR